MGTCNPATDGCEAARRMVNEEAKSRESAVKEEAAARDAAIQGLYAHVNHGFERVQVSFDRVQANLDGLRLWLMGIMATAALAAVGWVVSLLK